ncbi:MAG: ATP-binding cassette domain-containing protein [Microbacteriaceae bacterium]|jgi:energy-coupling factor transport system ATP-binding protein|nr:ATP-binding cassette domain-containing protein [Microbacteriaceae bacterium]MCI1207125.1 ATP-binding cassette domain-containing protein [Microbacteriaceae bacterium]
MGRRAGSIEAHGWGWRYGERTAAAVSDVSFRIDQGEHVLLIGPSGAGKSTLLAGLAGVLGAEDDGEESGELLIGGQTPRPGQAGLMLQNPESQIVMSRVGDDVAFGCENFAVDPAQIWSRVTQSLHDVQLDVALSRDTGELSGGQQQRLALAGILAMRPQVLLADEPTANLDPEGVAEVSATLTAAARETGATLVVVEHRVDVWLPLVDRVLVVAGGRLVADGTPQQVIREQLGVLRSAGVWLPDEHPEVSLGSAPQGDTLLQLEDVSVGRDSQHLLLSGVETQFSVGELVALTGKNGLGKTTLAYSLAGLVAPRSGSVVAAPALRRGLGSDPFSWPSKRLVSRIGTVFQNPEHQFVSSTVRRELSAGPRAANVPEDEIRKRCDELLGRLRLERLAEANPYTLSGGEQRRLSVATMLATRPSFLVLDEPTFGQDANTWRELSALLRELLSEGVGIAAITHDRLFVDTVADRELPCGRWRAV